MRMDRVNPVIGAFCTPDRDVLLPLEIWQGARTIDVSVAEFLATLRGAASARSTWR